MLMYGVLALFLLIWLIVLYDVLTKRKFKKLEVEQSRFEHPFFDWLYRYSFVKPFSWFVDDDNELTTKGEKVKEKLITAGYYNRIFTVRSYMMFTTVIFFALVILGVLIAAATLNLEFIYKILFNVEVEPTPINLQRMLVIMMVVVLLGLIPNQVLKMKAKKAIYNKNKDLPMLMMFVILMLRSGKSTAEIMYDLTKVKSNQQEIFEKAYRIYTRSPKDALILLKNHFGDGLFSDMFDLLMDVSEYAKEETVMIMESNMKSFVDTTNEIKRRNDLTMQVYSQGSMSVPFIAVIFLGVAPLLAMSFNAFAAFSI